MCPFCVATAAVAAAGGTSAGALAVLAVRKFRRLQPQRSWVPDKEVVVSKARAAEFKEWLRKH